MWDGGEGFTTKRCRHKGPIEEIQMIRCRQRVDIQSGFADVLCSGVRLRRPCAELLIVWTELSEGQEDISIRVGCHVSAREAGDSRGESTERTQREELLH